MQYRLVGHVLQKEPISNCGICLFKDQRGIILSALVEVALQHYRYFGQKNTPLGR